MAIRIVRDRLKTLCATCKNVRIREYDDGGVFVECMEASHYGARVTRPVTECSAYSQKMSMGKSEAYAIGWTLEVRKGEVIGFRNPAKDKGRVYVEDD